MHRFYLSSLDLQKIPFTIIEPRIVFQMNKVLRMKSGDFFHVFNQTEGEFLLQIESIDKKKLTAKRIQAIENKAEPQLEVSLYPSLPKKPALFEWIVQKATEIGVSHIVPLITQRTQNRRLAKLERLQLIALEATEQCGRLKIPTLHPPVAFEEVLPKLSNPYLAYEFEREFYLQDYGDKLYKKQELQLIIGPEGGFSEREISLAKKHKIPSFSLGPRILRMETAAIMALGLVLLRRDF